jgi:(1->4)-alpha-D-glucan 1-alpha-D-glucosylmutase
MLSPLASADGSAIEFKYWAATQRPVHLLWRPGDSDESDVKRMPMCKHHAPIPFWHAHVPVPQECENIKYTFGSMSEEDKEDLRDVQPWTTLAVQQAMRHPALHSAPSRPIATYEANNNALSDPLLIDHLHDLDVDCVILKPTDDHNKITDFVERAHALNIQVWLDVDCVTWSSRLVQFLRPICSSAFTADGDVSFSHPAVLHIFAWAMASRIHLHGLDGLRLLNLSSRKFTMPDHFVVDLAAMIKSSAPHTFLSAKDDQNIASLVLPTKQHACLDAVFSGDFERCLASVTTEMDGDIRRIEQVVRRGWLHTGQEGRGWGDPNIVPVDKFGFGLNFRADSCDNSQPVVDFRTFMASSALFLLLPQTPSIPAGHESMMLREHTKFVTTRDHSSKGSIPSVTLELYRDLLRIRRDHLVPVVDAIRSTWDSDYGKQCWRPQVSVLAPGILAVSYHKDLTSTCGASIPDSAVDKSMVLIVCLTHNDGAVDIQNLLRLRGTRRERRHLWYVRWSTDENPRYYPTDSHGQRNFEIHSAGNVHRLHEDVIELDIRLGAVRFRRPGAILLERHETEVYVPASTYRLQLRHSFPMSKIPADYLQKLGADTLYFSPICAAPAGSPTGYDGVSYDSLNAEIGTVDQMVEMGKKFHIMADFVPNHLGILHCGSYNKWWWDILERGPASQYAGYFDIFVKWHEGHKLLVPVLQHQVKECIERREILISDDGQRLLYLPTDEINVDTPITERVTEAFRAQYPLQFPVCDSVREAICRQHPSPEERKRLHITHPDVIRDVLNHQYYELAFWKSNCAKANYRRFFDMYWLLAVRQEDPVVFQQCHSMLLDTLVKKKVICGMRLDHTDGLTDPLGYFQQLQRMSPRSTYVVVEKVLCGSERLNPTGNFCIHGTSGYDFMRVVYGWYVSQTHASDWWSIFHKETGVRAGPDCIEDLEYECKKLVLQQLLRADVNVIAEVGNIPPEAVVEFLASFSVYRTFFRTHAPSSRIGDNMYLEEALQNAAKRMPRFDFSRIAAKFASMRKDARAREFVQRVQQVTDPTMAKGVEDTLFYRHTALLAANEVGFDPTEFGLDTDVLHRDGIYRAKHMPYSILATSTHDAKRSEDAHAALSALSEIPLVFQQLFHKFRKLGGGPILDAHSDWFILQSLLSAWPISVDRLLPCMIKSMQEAKIHTCMLEPNAEYETRLCQRIQMVYADNEWMTELQRFQADILRPAAVLNAVSRRIIQLTFPGVPDIYQGTECFFPSLVDPDNRRAVDFVYRQQLLDKLDKAQQWEDCFQNDDMAKMQVTRSLLQLRKSTPDLFLEASYLPVTVSGSLARHFVAYVRHLPESHPYSINSCIVVAPRFPVSLFDRRSELSSTFLELPPDIGCRGRVNHIMGNWTDCLSFLPDRAYRQVNLVGKRVPLKGVLSLPCLFAAVLIPALPAALSKHSSSGAS